MSSNLREMIESGELIVAPGAYDALTAKLIERAGFAAVYMSGYCTAATKFGLPDVGLVTQTEMVANVRTLASAIGLPVIADGDTGHGNAMNVVRTVREYEHAGAAALHIEDQVWPKRCGHMSGKQVIAAEDMVTKVRAAVDSRSSEDLVVIARTDALAVDGLEAAVERCHLYAEAGADVVFVDGQQTMEHIEEVPRRCPGLRCMINFGPLTPPLAVEEIANLGYAIAIYPGICFGPAVQATRTALAGLQEGGRAPETDKGDALELFAALNGLLGAPEYLELEEKYRS